MLRQRASPEAFSSSPMSYSTDFTIPISLIQEEPGYIPPGFSPADAGDVVLQDEAKRIKAGQTKEGGRPKDLKLATSRNATRLPICSPSTLRTSRPTS